MKKIYIIMTQTGTLLSRIIKLYTGCEYAHVSVSLDKDLDEMYSFGRLNPYNPFWGGFVHEKVNAGTFKRFKNTVAEISELEITDEAYDRIKNTIKNMEERIAPYRFNILGLIGAGFNIRVHMKDHFYCAEFVNYLFESAGVDLNLPKIITPDDFKKVENTICVYKGKLSEYKERRTEILTIEAIKKLKEISNKQKEVM